MKGVLIEVENGVVEINLDGEVVVKKYRYIPDEFIMQNLRYWLAHWLDRLSDFESAEEKLLQEVEKWKGAER